MPTVLVSPCSEWKISVILRRIGDCAMMVTIGDPLTLPEFRGVRLCLRRGRRAGELRLHALQVLESLGPVAELVVDDAEFVHRVADFGVRRILIDDLCERLTSLFGRTCRSIHLAQPV